MINEKYTQKTRSIYALIFKGRVCYIGQSVNCRKRWQQHLSSGHWRSLGPFTPVLLGSYTGTRAQLEEWEYAWRIVAHRAGWRVVGGYNGHPYCVDPLRRATSHRLALAQQCQWHVQQRDIHHENWMFSLLWLFLVVLVVIGVLTKL